MTAHLNGRCGAVRASLMYRAPMFSEASPCVLAEGHGGDHQDRHGATWYVIPLNADRFDLGQGADE